MSTEFWGVDVEFERGEIAVVDSANVECTIKEVHIDTQKKEVHYFISFPLGSIYVEHQCGKGGTYQKDTGWAKSSELLKIKQKQPSLWRDLINFISGKWDE